MDKRPVTQEAVKPSQKEVRLIFVIAGCGCGFLVASLSIFVYVICATLYDFNEWLDAERWSDFMSRNGPEIELDRIALQQIQEYSQEGKASSKLYINSECYETGETKISNSPPTITNTIRYGRGCSDFGPLNSYGDRLFFMETNDPSKIKVARVSCEGMYIGDRQFATSEDTFPMLIDGHIPRCPLETRDRGVAPSYTEYIVIDGKVNEVKAPQ